MYRCILYNNACTIGQQAACTGVYYNNVCTIGQQAACTGVYYNNVCTIGYYDESALCCYGSSKVDFPHLG